MTATTGPSKTPKQATIARPVLPPRSRPGGGAAGDRNNTYVADSFAGDADMTFGGTPVLAQDGEPAGLARVTFAMRAQAERLPPAPRRLVGLCSWAAAVGLLGIIVGIRAVVVMLVGAASWFPLTAGVIGIIGVGATMGAFVTARHQHVPWALLSVSSLTLIAATIVTSAAS